MTKHTHSRHVVTALAAVSISLLAACTTESEDLIDDEAIDASQPGSPATTTDIETAGDPAQLGSEAVVVLTGGCSGVLLNPHTIATVEHCLPIEAPASEQARAQLVTLTELEVRGEQRCLTPAADGSCATWSLSIARQSGTDLVLLQSEIPFADVDPEQLPVLALGDAEVGFAHAFAFASPIDDIDRAQRQSTRTELRQHDASYRYGVTAAGARACGIDSGGPLLAASAEAGTASVLGLLSAAQYDADGCLAEGGLERWVRIDPNFLRAHSSGCADTDAGLDCRFAELHTPAGELALDVAPPVTAETFTALGIDLIDPASRTPEQIDAEGLVGLALADGDYLVAPGQLQQLGEVSSDGERDGEASNDVQSGELVPLRSRTREPLNPYGLALNGNGDQRDEFFVKEAGNLRPDGGTSPFCTGTLIGKRIVRTAKHCIENTAQPWFTIRYNNGPTTWTFDGGQTWVTFQPRQSSFHYYGGNYFNFGCNAFYGSSCVPQDWALLVMPQNVWDPVNTVPSYMGLASPGIAVVGNTGYPSCSDISSPDINPCVYGKMYGMDNCMILLNFGSYYYTNCDVSPGHSGGPTFRTTNGTRYLLGHHVAGPSSTCGPSCQAADTGTDSWLMDFQLDLRATYSAVTL